MRKVIVVLSIGFLCACGGGGDAYSPVVYPIANTEVKQDCGLEKLNIGTPSESCH